MIRELIDREIFIINTELGYDSSSRLKFFGYDIRKSSCFSEINENLANGVKSFEVEDNLTGQDEEEIMICIGFIYNGCIIRSERDLRIKMQFDVEEDRINIKARLIDVADHREDSSYVTRLVIENELWTIDELKLWIAQDLNLNTEEEIDLALEEELDKFIETKDALINYESKFSVAIDL